MRVLVLVVDVGDERVDDVVELLPVRVGLRVLEVKLVDPETNLEEPHFCHFDQIALAATLKEAPSKMGLLEDLSSVWVLQYQ